jgi:hypothetical protein
MAWQLVSWTLVDFCYRMRTVVNGYATGRRA